MNLLIIATIIFFKQTLAITLSLNETRVQHSVDNSNVTDILEYVLLDQTNTCNRTCVKGGPPMICRYNFLLEWYTTLSKACYNCPNVTEDCFRPHCIPGDGTPRPILVINRQLPGPSIEVCLGDEIIVEVDNQLVSESTAIHWHGIHQIETPYMDGVPYVTQCPIPSLSTFRYHFKAANPGTHFWHSHSGFQRADGAFGPLIVKVPEEDDPHANLYDYDLSSHVITLIDWGEEIGMHKFVAHHHSDGDNKPATLLINGLGRFKEYNMEDNTTVYIPPARFTVEQGYRYRMRIINAGFLNCPIELSVDNHTLTVISSDGYNFEPMKAESLVTYAGERFDIIIHADQPNGLYWMRFRGLMDCSEKFTSAHQVAVLQYDGADVGQYDLPEGTPDYSQSHKEGLQINSLNRGIEDNSSMYVALPLLKSLDEWDESLKEKPDFQYYVSYDFYKIDNPHFHKFPLYGFNNVTDTKNQLLTPQLNHITMKMLPVSLLSQRYELDESKFCNESTVNNCENDFCECPHVIKIPLNSVVEMIIIDKGFAFDANHPFHLHGHAFRVVGMEKLGHNTTVQEVMERDKQGLIKRNLKQAPVKDTVNVPDGGYTILRFKASNPGYWLFHCHIEFHVEVGMAIVFKIGENDQMKPIPKNFPTCGNYQPDLHEEECQNKTQGVLKSIEKFILNTPDTCAAYTNKYSIVNLLICLFVLSKLL